MNDKLLFLLEFYIENVIAGAEKVRQKCLRIDAKMQGSA